MKEEKVWFKNSRGQRLCGVLEGTRGAKAAILLISGYASGKDEWGNFMVRYAAALNNAGFLTLRFDRAGIGESEGDFVESTLETELDDCIAAYNFLKTRCNVVGVAGHSMGGALAVMLSSKVNSGAVVVSAPVVILSKVFKELYTEEQIKTLEKEGKLKVPEDWESFGIKFQGAKYWKSRLDFNMADYARLIKAPTLIVQGTRDEYIDMEQSKLLLNMLECEKRLEIIEGASHSMEPYEEKFHAIVITWFKKYL